MGAGPGLPGSASHSVELTLASVRPYATTTRMRPDQRAISSLGTASVPTTRTAPSGSGQSRGSAETSEGGRIMWVARCRATYSVRAGPATRRSAGTTTIRPPTHSDMIRSQTVTSKPTEANCTTRLSESTPIRSVAVAIRLPTPSWVTTTPLGRPVEPEV